MKSLKIRVKRKREWSDENCVVCIEAALTLLVD